MTGARLGGAIVRHQAGSQLGWRGLAIELGFDRRGELHPPGSDLIDQKTVHLFRVQGIEAVDHAQGREGNVRLPQAGGCGHDLLERGLAAAGLAIGIVQCLRAIDGEADVKVVLAQEGNPAII